MILRHTGVFGEHSAGRHSIGCVELWSITSPANGGSSIPAVKVATFWLPDLDHGTNGLACIELNFMLQAPLPLSPLPTSFSPSSSTPALIGIESKTISGDNRDYQTQFILASSRIFLEHLPARTAILSSLASPRRPHTDYMWGNWMLDARAGVDPVRCISNVQYDPGLGRDCILQGERLFESYFPYSFMSGETKAHVIVRDFNLHRVQRALSTCRGSISDDVWPKWFNTDETPVSPTHFTSSSLVKPQTRQLHKTSLSFERLYARSYTFYSHLQSLEIEPHHLPEADDVGRIVAENFDESVMKYKLPCVEYSFYSGKCISEVPERLDTLLTHVRETNAEIFGIQLSESCLAFITVCTIWLC